MATLRSPLGDVIGSFGNLTGAKVGGKNILKAKVGKNGSNTIAQQTQRHKFAELTVLYKKLKAAIQAGLPKAGVLSPYNRFVQANDQFMSVDQDLVASIDFGQMVLAAGDGGLIGPALTLTATKIAGFQQVRFAWTTNIGGISRAGDKPVLVVVDTVTNETFVAAHGGNAGANRSELEDSVDVPGITDANKAQYKAYLFFVRDGEKGSSTQLVDVVG